MPNFNDLIRQFQDASKSNENVTASRFSKSDPTILKYPLNNQDDYGGTITFKARKIEARPLGAAAFEFLAPEYKETVTVNPATEEFRRQEQRIAGQLNSAKRSSVDNANFRTSERLPNRLGSDRKCTLYLPGAIQIADKVSYSNVDLGVLGATVRAGITSGRSGREILGDIGVGIRDTFTNLIGSLKAGAGTEEAQIAAQRVFGSTSAVGGAISSATGVSLNPNRRAVLSGPEIRNFAFTFRLIPTSPAEGNAVEKIIQFFREEMYPEAVETAGVSAAFRYPSIFDITMRYRTATGQYRKVATQLLPSFLQSVDVNYNQSGMSFHRDGRPQEATLTLNFTEERTLSKADVAVRGY